MQVDVFAAVESLAIASDAPQGVSPIQGRCVDHCASITLQQTRFDLFVAGADVQRADRATIGVDLVYGRADCHAFWMGLEEGDLSFEAFWIRDVVGIHSRDIGPSCLGEPLVQPAHEARVWRHVYPDPIISIGQGG